MPEGFQALFKGGQIPLQISPEGHAQAGQKAPVQFSGQTDGQVLLFPGKGRPFQGKVLQAMAEGVGPIQKMARACGHDVLPVSGLLISALKSKLFPAEDRPPKNVVFGGLSPLRGDISRTADVQISMRKSVN
jgi:hypothetical protein